MRREREGEESERREEKERRKRDRKVIWREAESDDLKERRYMVEEIMKALAR